MKIITIRWRTLQIIISVLIMIHAVKWSVWMFEGFGYLDRIVAFSIGIALGRWIEL